jgi:agmatinase
MSSNQGFLGLNHPYKSSRVVVIQAPYERTTSYMKGTVRGPRKIVEASGQVEYFDEELWTDPSRVGIHTPAPLSFSGRKPREVLQMIAREVGKSFRAGKFPVLLGGEHTVTAGAIQGLKDEADFSVLYFDAHPDLRYEYEGSKYSHACAARRVYEMNPNLVIFGARTFCEDQAEFLKQNPVPIFWAHDLARSPRLWDKIVPALKPNVYLSIDLDGFDPAIMPAVGTPVPGGISWYDFLNLVKMVAKKRQIIGFDVVELRPQKGFEFCDFTAARLLYRVLGYALHKELKVKI